MSEPGRRRYVPAEAYRFMVLAALAHRRGAPASKGDLAWETRANHYMLTRVLRELEGAGHLTVARGPSGFEVALTPAGAAFLEAHGAYAASTFRAAFEAQFQFGTVPAWARPYFQNPS